MEIKCKEEAEEEIALGKMVENTVLFQKIMESKLTSVAFAQIVLLILNCLALLV